MAHITTRKHIKYKITFSSYSFSTSYEKDTNYQFYVNLILHKIHSEFS